MFSRGKGSAMPLEGEIISVIGVDVVITGNVECKTGLHVDGTVNGDISCLAFSQGESGAVHGNIVAEEARLAGLVDGAVEAGSLTLESSARIMGDVVYESLTVARGAEVEGRFRRRRPGDHGSLGARLEKQEDGTSSGLFAAAPPALAPPTALAAE